MIFKSKLSVVQSFAYAYSDEVIKNEPMFFNCDLEFAYKNGGVITKQFIEKLPSKWKDCNPVVDSRVHMLMKDWYPCIPGWHHDDVPRSTTTGQPNYITPEYHSEHLLGLVNADVCPTRFITTPVEVSAPDVNKTIYEQWHKEIEAQKYESYETESGLMYEFDCNTFHSGQKAVKNGWRWFIRLSRNTDRQNNITNEIRKQVQVYLENPIMGW